MNIEDIAIFDKDGYICRVCSEKKPKMGIWTHWRIQHTEEGRQDIKRSHDAAAIASSELIPCPNCNEMFPKSGLPSHMLGEERAKKKRAKILSNKCERCNEQITEVYGSGRFCSQKCARGSATAGKREEINKKTSESIKKKYENGEMISPVDYRWGTKEEREKRKSLKFVEKQQEKSKKLEERSDEFAIIERRKIKKAHPDVVDCLFCGKESAYRKDKRFCSTRCGIMFRYDKRNPAYEENMKKAQKAGIASAQSQRETRRSKNEIYFSELCSTKFSGVLCNEPIFDGWDADVIIPELKVAVLWNGPWHRRKITKKHSVAQVQKRDEIKCVKILEAGYIMYVIDDEGKCDKEFVEKEFKKFIDFLKI